MSLVVSSRGEGGREGIWASWEGVAFACEIAVSTGSWTRGDGGAESRDGPAVRREKQTIATAGPCLVLSKAARV